jgi:hypothetical protein
MAKPPTPRPKTSSLMSECDWCKSLVEDKTTHVIRGKLLGIKRRLCIECYRDYQLKEIGI